ncbi:hypothetical protein ACTXT7_007543 [Hymenolepis weldensis]
MAGQKALQLILHKLPGKEAYQLTDPLWLNTMLKSSGSSVDPHLMHLQIVNIRISDLAFWNLRELPKAVEYIPGLGTAITRQWTEFASAFLKSLVSRNVALHFLVAK